MKRNKNTLNWSKRILLKKGKGFLVLLLATFALISNLYAQTIWPAEISFNYSGSNAITIQDYDIAYGAPEYEGSSTYATPESYAAYIAGEGKISIKVKFNSSDASMNYLVKATVVSGTGLGDICEMFVASCDLNSKEFTIELPTDLPIYVAKTSFTWEWEATALPTSSPFCPISCTSVSTSHVIYTLLSTPKAPMSTPWIDVLDYACVWANGNLSEANILYDLCNNLYNNSGLEYDGERSHYEYNYSTQIMEFKLTAFLADWDFADCQDMSMFLSILSSSIGASLNQTKRIEGTFWTKNIDPVGTTYDWDSYKWDFHHVAWLNNVFDPCISLNQSGTDIPIDCNIESYESKVRNSGTWSPQTAFVLGQTDPTFNKPSEIK